MTQVVWGFLMHGPFEYISLRIGPGMLSELTILPIRRVRSYALQHLQ